MMLNISFHKFPGHLFFFGELSMQILVHVLIWTLTLLIGSLWVSYRFYSMWDGSYGTTLWWLFYHILFVSFVALKHFDLKILGFIPLAIGVWLRIPTCTFHSILLYFQRLAPLFWPLISFSWLFTGSSYSCVSFLCVIMHSTLNIMKEADFSTMYAFNTFVEHQISLCVSVQVFINIPH